MESFLSLKEKKTKDNKKTSLMLEDVFFDHQGNIELTAFVGGEKGKEKKVFSETIDHHNNSSTKPKPKNTLFSVSNDLLKARVFSESGVYFGRVYDIEIETNLNRIENILINKHFWEKFFKSPLIINNSQVLEYQKKKVIVKEALIKEFELGGQKATM